MNSGEINTAEFYRKFGSAAAYTAEKKDVRQSPTIIKTIPVVISNITKRYRLKKAAYLKEETVWNAAQTE
jgi:hypothetical protein